MIGLATPAVLAVFGLGGCGHDGGERVAAPDLSGVDVTVGWVGDDDTDLILGELYAQVLEARGATVERRPGLTDRQDALHRLESGAVSVVPERSHALLAELTAPTTPDATTILEQLDALGDALPAGVTVLTPSSAHDSEVVACRQRVIDEYDLTTRSDLDQLLTDRPADLAEEDCRTLPATDPAIEREGLVALVDDQLDAPLDALVPLASADAATPELQATLDALSSTLEPATLPALLGRLRLDGDEAPDVARDWLEAVDLT